MLDSLLSPQLLAAAIISASMYAVISTGLNLVYGTLRLLNIAHGDLVMLGAYVAFWSSSLLGLSPLISLWAAMAMGALLGVALYQGVFVRVIRNGQLAEQWSAWDTPRFGEAFGRLPRGTQAGFAFDRATPPA